MSYLSPVCLSRGQLVVSCFSVANQVLIGKADPGLPEGSLLVWDKYEPGTCVLCKQVCGKVLWKGLRRDRGKIRKSDEDSRPRGVELSGPVKITLCKECLDHRDGRKYNVCRMDHASAGPCCAKSTYGLLPCSDLVTPKNFELGYMSVRSSSEYTDNNISDELRGAYNCQKGKDQEIEIKMGEGRRKHYVKTDLGQYVATTWTNWPLLRSTAREEVKCPDSLIDWATTITQKSEVIFQQRREQELKIKFQGRKLVLNAHVIKYTTDSGRTCAYTHNIYLKPEAGMKHAASA